MRKALRSTAIRQSAHAVALLAKGCPIDLVTMQSEGIYAGRCVATREHYEAMKHRDKALALLAGGLAEERFSPDYRLGESGSDRRDFVSLVRLLSEGGSADTKRAIHRAVDDTTEFVTAHWPEIQALAEILMERKTMTGDEVAAFRLNWLPSK